ncbi:efflux RND transporter periplasmic adaptor subunit [Flavobacteriaceae bacterium R38]|nr:efflux RND transporter periplasmic adaptor subunit [Flavobacteriaceae bacterium R38]
MKRNLIYIGLATIAGVFIGYLIFGSSSHTIEEHNHELELAENGMWTCSMHPQIMQKEPGSCPICSMDLIPVASSEEELSVNQIKMSENALALANVQTTVVGSEFVKDNTLKLSGKISENEESNTAQTAHFGGRLEKLYINSTGEEIKKGQLLALIYSPELVAAQQELLTALSLKSTQPDLYDAVRQKLKLWKLSDQQIQRIETSGKVTENFPVYSNVSGVVSKKMVEEGNHVMEGQSLLKITNLNTVWAEFDAYENQIALLKKGQSVRIKANAYPDTDFNSEISFIEPVLNTATRTIMIRTVLSNQQKLFKPGMFVEGAIEIEQNDKTPMITIPKSAVLWTGKRSLVYVKPDAESAVFEMREVTLGNSLDDSYEIRTGLNPGDEIVVNGAFTIDAAAQLQGKKSMMNAKEGKVHTGHEGHSGM